MYKYTYIHIYINTIFFPLRHMEKRFIYLSIRFFLKEIVLNFTE